MKKFTHILIGISLLISPAAIPATAGEISDEHWTPAPIPTTEGWRSLYLGDNLKNNRALSTIYAEEEPSVGGNFKSYHCSTLASEKCVELKRITSTAFLQPCSDQLVTNCIESFYAIDPRGTRISAMSPTNYPKSSRWDYQENFSANLPAGGTPTVWSIPGLNHGGGGTNYMVQAIATSLLEKNPRSMVKGEEFTLQRLSVTVSPVSLIKGKYSQHTALDSTETRELLPRGQGMIATSVDDWQFCAMVGDGDCNQRQKFPENVKFGVKIKLKNKISGWLHGRISNPQVSIMTSKDNSQTIEVLADPVEIPVVGEWFKWNQLSRELQDYVLEGYVSGGQGDFKSKNQANGTFQEIIGPSYTQSFTALGLWLPLLRDKASANPTTWTFSNLSELEMVGSSSCIRDATDLVGIVTTNATVYSAGAPIYNKANNSLDYKVMAPHFTSKGEIFRGTYDLRLRSDIARCIFKFSSAPIQASLTILSESGESSVATEVINEKNGWLNLSAKGFTYSMPTIQVKISQAAVVLPAPEITTQAAPKPVAKKLTITCSKGKVKKKVTAAKPVCPKGYEKVA